MVDKVKPLKMESSVDGTENDVDYTETDPSEDYIAAKGIALENSNSHTVDLSPEGYIQFKDTLNTLGVTLKDLITGIGELGENIIENDLTLVSQDVTNGYIDLSFIVIPHSLILYHGRAKLHETIDYTLSTVGEVTRVTFIGTSAPGGDEEIAVDSVIKYKYKQTYGDIMAAYRDHYKEINSADITNGYIDLPHKAKDHSITSWVGRLGFHAEIDYDVSVVNGVTRITFKGDFLPTGSSPMSTTDVVFFNYQL
jgi:hypothetical protein